jgi:glutamine amidotransferase
MAEQSVRHSDGWGVAYYVNGTPHVVRSIDAAGCDSMFKRISEAISTNTFLSHLRKATVGSLNALNTHPFQYGRWIFAHNGNIKNFSNVRDRLIRHIDPLFVRHVLGTTDSEVFFYLILTSFLNRGLLDDMREVVVSDYFKAIQHALEIVIEEAGSISAVQNGDPNDNYYTFIITNGAVMIGFNGGQDLYYSTHKSNCSVKANCPFFGNMCERPVSEGSVVRHLLISSEVIVGENVWSLLPRETIVGVDKRMIFEKAQLFGASADNERDCEPSRYMTVYAAPNS